MKAWKVSFGNCAETSSSRTLCGFEPKTELQADGSYKVFVAPSASSYSKFLKNLTECQDELDRMFTSMVGYMYENLDGFGEILMVDGKAIQSYGTKPSTKKDSGGRGEHDADWCKKQYSASGPNGESVIKTKKWFGFRMHLIADATYELPVAFSVTKASCSEQKETETLLEQIKTEHEEWLDYGTYFLGDKGYDSTSIILKLEDAEIYPIIDIRNCWKDGEETHQYRDTRLVYDYKGTVWYVDEDGKKIEMLYRGYDKGSDSLRYGFPPGRNDKRIFRIKCEEDRRIFTPVARSSYKWERLYKKRTGVERVNGRIDRDFKFEKHTIRGLAKMTMFLTVTFLVYMGMAKAKISEGEKEHLCRLYA